MKYNLVCKSTKISVKNGLEISLFSTIFLGNFLQKIRSKIPNRCCMILIGDFKI